MDESLTYRDRSEEYNSERSPNEVDLLAVVSKDLRESGLFIIDSHLREYFESQGVVNKKPNVQRFYLNKYFTLVLLVYPDNTMDQRYCLINDGTVEDWLDLFRRKVLPFLRNHPNV